VCVCVCVCERERERGRERKQCDNCEVKLNSFAKQKNCLLSKPVHVVVRIGKKRAKYQTATHLDNTHKHTIADLKI